MPYLIDGHNLIPHVRGLNLQQLDDEQELMKRLDAYFQRQRKQAVLYFDRAQPGGSADMRRAFLQVHFVRPPAIADDAILQHLRKLGGEAKNWVVVSSDQEVCQGAERMGARTLASKAFAALLDEENPTDANSQSARQEDLDYWLDLFDHH
jgi:predicted RNA-binding protein with PIN domain